MRLIDADAFFKNYPELAIEPYINTPTVEPKLKDDIIEAFNQITDQEFEHHDSFWIITPKGKKIEFEKKKPQGEWITFSTNHSIIQCSECTALLNNLRADIFKDKIGKMNFCPNCGAKMGGEEP